MLRVCRSYNYMCKFNEMMSGHMLVLADPTENYVISTIAIVYISIFRLFGIFRSNINKIIPVVLRQIPGRKFTTSLNSSCQFYLAHYGSNKARRSSGVSAL